jgi:hypothetical protein
MATGRKVRLAGMGVYPYRPYSGGKQIMKRFVAGMRSAFFLALVTGQVSGMASPALAQEKSTLPASGTFKIHSGWKGVGENVKVGENHVFGTGNFWGVTYNDAGSGPLHMGAVVCSYTLDLTSGAGPFQGTCVWSDGDGDQIFTGYSGKISASGALDGMNKITGGTGKFRGIQGQAPFQCRSLNDKAQITCTQQFEYQFASGAK